MKRLVFFIMLVLFGVTLLSCASNSFTIEQSKKNYETYCDAVQLVADKHGIELTEVTDYSSYKDICVQTNIGRIDIRITNSAFEAEKGVESFSIDYFLSSENSIEESDIKLFCDFANCISGEELPFDLCLRFLDAPESEYAAEDYGYQKANGELVAKMYPLNFFEDWCLCYFETTEEKQLSFGGITKSN